MYYIDKSLKPRSLNLFLTRPNRMTIGKLKHIRERKLTVNFGLINELTFTIPCEITSRSKLIRNPVFDLVREKYLIRCEYGNFTEWFIITKITKSFNDSNDLLVECKSLGYQLYHQKMIDYTATSYNCLQVLTDCLSGTGWTVGYINPDFNLKYRQFDVSSSTKLDFIYSIATTFEGISTFDTENKKVNIYKEEEISQYKGFIISYGKYLNTVEDIIDGDLITTRLHAKGNNGLTINSVNPSGQDYIDDFSYFLYPFNMDNNGNVITSSYYMSDDLAKALVNYNTYVSGKKDDFNTLLTNLSAKQNSLTTEQTKLDTLNHDLQLILDDIEIAKTDGTLTDALINQQNQKNADITTEKNTITSIQSDITSINNQITSLKNDLKMENHLSAIEMDELYNFIHEDEWSDENQIDPNDLYNAALTQMATVNSPPVNMNLSIIDFVDMVTEQRNWDRLNIGDIIKIRHDKLNILIKTKVSQIVFDFDNISINVTITSLKKIDNDLEKIKRAFYTINKVNTDYNSRKINWSKIANNFNARNDRLSETPTKPTIPINGISKTINDNGSANITLTWNYPNYTATSKNEDNIDGFLIYLHSDLTNTPYIFGSQMASETIVDVIYTSNSYTFPSVPPNLYYTIGIRAYRSVDNDINPDGIIMSDIVVFNGTNSNGFIPYQPTPSVTVKANLQGTLNGVNYTVSAIPPTNPQNHDKWTDTSGTYPVDKIYNATTNKWDKTVSTQINDVVGEINGVASLDNTGNVPISQLNHVFKFKTGTFTGDGTESKFVNVGFNPSLVKIYTTNTMDDSLYINSTSGGYLLFPTASSIQLKGDTNSLAIPMYGQLTTGGFLTGNTTDIFGNKTGNVYYWEAYYIPYSN